MAARVLVTRAAKQAGRLSEALRARGFEPVEVPLLEIAPPASFEPLDRALDELESFDWLLVTSVNTVEALVRRAEELGLDLAPPRIAAVGSATAEAVRKAGWELALTPQKYVAESLVEALLDSVGGKRILLARAAVARDVIPDALTAAGAEMTVVDAYRNRMPQGAAGHLRAVLEQGIDVATFTSSSSVEHLFEALRESELTWPLPGVKAVSIGPITSQKLRDLGWPPDLEASPFDIPGLVEAVARVF